MKIHKGALNIMRLAIVFAKFCSDVISTVCWTEAYAFVSQTGCLFGEAEGKVFFNIAKLEFPLCTVCSRGRQGAIC